MPDVLAFMFPGQGSQFPGMLADLAGRDPLVVQTFQEASTGAGIDLWAIAQDASGDALGQTEFTQPALLAANVAVWRLWLKAGGPRPTLLAGHSLGEYAALVASGVIGLADAARLVRERGRAMQDAVPAGTGAMAAVIGADDEQVAAICRSVSDDDVVVPANYNSPGQVVIGGHAAAVDRAISALGEQGVRKVVKLAVSVPSHTPLMREAANRLGEVMAGMRWSAPVIQVVQNVDAEVHGSVEAIRDALQRQLYLPVRWTGCVESLAARGATRLGECGPGKVLSGLARRIDKSLQAMPLGGVAEFDSALAQWRG